MQDYNSRRAQNLFYREPTVELGAREEQGVVLPHHDEAVEPQAHPGGDALAVDPHREDGLAGL